MQVQQINSQQPAMVPLRSGKWRGIVRHDWAAQFSDVDLLDWIRQSSHEQTRDRVSRQLYRVQADAGDVYVKVMIGTNDRAVEKPTLGARLRWSLRPSRAMQTMRVCRRMLAGGLLCPPPVLAARTWAGGMPTDVFINETVDGRGVGDMLFAAADEDQRLGIVRFVGPQIARLHRAKLLHGDLLPNNLIADHSLEHVCFLDNDRTRYWPTGLSARRRCENLFQFAFRLLKLGEPLVEAFVRAYAESADWSTSTRDRHTHAILADIRERKARRVARKAAQATEDADNLQ